MIGSGFVQMGGIAELAAEGGGGGGRESAGGYGGDDVVVESAGGGGSCDEVESAKRRGVFNGPGAVFSEQSGVVFERGISLAGEEGQESAGGCGCGGGLESAGGCGGGVVGVESAGGGGREEIAQCRGIFGKLGAEAEAGRDGDDLARGFPFRTIRSFASGLDSVWAGLAVVVFIPCVMMMMVLRGGFFGASSWMFGKDAVGVEVGQVTLEMFGAPGRVREDEPDLAPGWKSKGKGGGKSAKFHRAARRALRRTERGGGFYDSFGSKMRPAKSRTEGPRNMSRLMKREKQRREDAADGQEGSGTRQQDVGPSDLEGKVEGIGRGLKLVLSKGLRIVEQEVFLGVVRVLRTACGIAEKAWCWLGRGGDLFGERRRYAAVIGNMQCLMKAMVIAGLLEHAQGRAEGLPLDSLGVASSLWREWGGFLSEGFDMARRGVFAWCGRLGGNMGLDVSLRGYLDIGVGWTLNFGMSSVVALVCCVAAGFIWGHLGNYVCFGLKRSDEGGMNDVEEGQVGQEVPVAWVKSPGVGGIMSMSVNFPSGTKGIDAVTVAPRLLVDNLGGRICLVDERGHNKGNTEGRDDHGGGVVVPGVVMSLLPVILAGPEFRGDVAGDGATSSRELGAGGIEELYGFNSEIDFLAAEIEGVAEQYRDLESISPTFGKTQREQEKGVLIREHSRLTEEHNRKVEHRKLLYQGMWEEFVAKRGVVNETDAEREKVFQSGVVDKLQAFWDALANEMLQQEQFVASQVVPTVPTVAASKVSVPQANGFPPVAFSIPVVTASGGGLGGAANGVKGNNGSSNIPSANVPAYSFGTGNFGLGAVPTSGFGGFANYTGWGFGAASSSNTQAKGPSFVPPLPPPLGGMDPATRAEFDEQSKMLEGMKRKLESLAAEMSSPVGKKTRMGVTLYDWFSKELFDSLSYSGGHKLRTLKESSGGYEMTSVQITTVDNEVYENACQKGTTDVYQALEASLLASRVMSRTLFCHLSMHQIGAIFDFARVSPFISGALDNNANPEMAPPGLAHVWNLVALRGSALMTSRDGIFVRLEELYRGTWSGILGGDVGLNVLTPCIVVEWRSDAGPEIMAEIVSKWLKCFEVFFGEQSGGVTWKECFEPFVTRCTDGNECRWISVDYLFDAFSCKMGQWFTLVKSRIPVQGNLNEKYAFGALSSRFMLRDILNSIEFDNDNINKFTLRAKAKAVVVFPRKRVKENFASAASALEKIVDGGMRSSGGFSAGVSGGHVGGGGRQAPPEDHKKFCCSAVKIDILKFPGKVARWPCHGEASCDRVHLKHEDVVKEKDYVFKTFELYYDGLDKKDVLDAIQNLH